MSTAIIQERLNNYHAQTTQEEETALKEIFQEIALASLGRTDFFKKAAFQGGTALRILYGLSRFSEDMDFTLQTPDPLFSFEKYLRAIQQDFLAYGITLEVKDRSKTDQAVKKAFLKDDSFGKVLNLHYQPPPIIRKKIRIKLEVDVNPPEGALFAIKYLDFPFASAVTAQDLPSLFAGKSHALLCREYLKGRDWYDFLWYIAQKAPINLQYLAYACQQQGPWKGQELNVTREWFAQEMEKKIVSIDWTSAQQDVAPFLKGRELESLELWRSDFFLDRLQKLKGY